MRLFINALSSPAGKGLTSWLSFVFSNYEVVTFPLVWCLIVSIPDLCTLSYFVIRHVRFAIMNNLKNIICGHVRRCVLFSVVFWIIYL